jgi:hypothetical protein
VTLSPGDGQIELAERQEGVRAAQLERIVFGDGAKAVNDPILWTCPGSANVLPASCRA